VINRKWGLTVGDYLNNDYFVNKYLSPGIVEESLRIVNSGSELEKFVLEWCMENLVPLRICNKRSWMHWVSYEQIITAPLSTAIKLCNELSLTSPKRMVEVIEKPSRTTKSTSRNLIKSLGPEAMLSKWVECVDLRDLGRVANIMNMFRITRYHASDPFPVNQIDSSKQS
jgi:hypothetical protein